MFLTSFLDTDATDTSAGSVQVSLTAAAWRGVTERAFKKFTGQREQAGLGIYHYQSRFYSPKLGRFLSADTIVPNMMNPQDFNRYSYVRNNPVRYTDPTGHAQWEDTYLSSNGTCKPGDTSCNWVKKTNKLVKPQGNESDGGNIPELSKDDEEVTISRGELIEIANDADELAVEYQTAGDRWESGTETVVGLGMLFVDGVTCVAAVTAPSVPTLAACGVAIYLTVVAVPLAAELAGAYGGHAHAQAYGTISEYLEDALINDSAQQFTVTVSQSTHTEVILPGGVGPTTTMYTISVDGYSESIQVYGPPGNDAILSLFGVVP